MQKILEKRRKQTEKKIKNKEKEKRRIQGSEITTKNIFCFTFYTKNHLFLENIV